MNSIAEAAIAKTIADEKENKKSTLEESSDPLTGEEKEKQNGVPKVKNVGFVNYKWTEIREKVDHTDDEEGGK